MRVSRRELLRKGVVLGAAVLTGCTTRLSGTPSAATSLPPEPDLPGSVTLGVFEYRPYVFKDDSGAVTGEVVEVVRAVCDKLGVSVRVVLAPYDTMLTRVAAGEIDVVGGLSIRERNCESLDFSVADHVSLSALVVPEGNPKKISTFADVVATGARLALVTDSLEVTEAAAAGIRDRQEFADAGLMLQALAEGDADCAAYDDITLRDLLTRVPDLELRPPFEPAGGAPRYGFGFRKGSDSGLRAAFDRILADMHRNGEWLRVAAPFGFAAPNIPVTESAEGGACGR